MTSRILSVAMQIDPGILDRLLHEAAVGGVVAALVYLIWRRYPLLSGQVAGRFAGWAKNPAPFVVAAMVLPVALRLAILPWVPPPQPVIADEFAHLLVADTLTEGRLANPPHPLSPHLETFYVLQQPAYASIYPIGNGAIMTVGQALTGDPWAGLLLAVALMGGAVSWMLFGCLPAGWAAAGGLLASIQYGLAAPNIDTYWGGAFCACGGALLFGALCRLKNGPSAWMGFVAGLGWSIVWLIRPFEAVFLWLIAWGFIVAFIAHEKGCWRSWCGTVALVVFLQVLAGAVTAVHNKAVTGSYTKLPYQLSKQEYGVPQSFLWQEPVDLPAFRFKESEALYQWQADAKNSADTDPLDFLSSALYETWEFFVTPWYSLPFLLLVFLWRDRYVLVGLGILTSALAATVLYPFFFPHYIAAYSCVFVFLVFRGTMLLWKWSFRGIVVGRFAVVFLMTGGLMMGLRLAPLQQIVRIDPRQEPRVDPRTLLRKRLAGLGGTHVVFVRYAEGHNFHREWVYNRADVDAAAIVWCRAMDPAEDAKVARYYGDRQMWIATVDEHNARVSRYHPGTEAEETARWVFWGRLER